MPPFDFSRFQWHRSPDDPALHIREAAGSEALHETWHRRYNGRHIIFFGAEIRLRAAASVDVFVTHAREAWSALRFDVPTVASQVSRNEEGVVFMTYRPASSPDDVDAWAQRTVRLSTISTQQSLNDLRNVLGPKPVPESNGDQTFLYVLPRTKNTDFGVLIHTSHVPFDGCGMKTLMNLFLVRLADCLSGHSGHAQLSWGQEVHNLLPSVTMIIKPEVPLSGPEYEQTMAEILGDLSRDLPRQHGFKLRGNGFGPTRCLWYRFSQAESERIIQRTHELGLRVNNILNAAVLLVTALDNPPTSSTPDDAAFVFYCLVDARDHIVPPYSGRGYPGRCLGLATIQVPLSILPSGFTESKEVALDALIKIAAALKDEYTKVMGRRPLLAAQAQMIDMIHPGMQEEEPFSQPWMGSWYSGDGPTELHIDNVHTDKTGTPVLEIRDVYVSLNVTEPGPFFRASSFMGMFHLSVDTNEVAMSVDVVQGFLDKWVELLLAFSASGKQDFGNETFPVSNL